jgi:hypothetical protein
MRTPYRYINFSGKGKKQIIGKKKLNKLQDTLFLDLVLFCSYLPLTVCLFKPGHDKLSVQTNYFRSEEF